MSAAARFVQPVESQAQCVHVPLIGTTPHLQATGAVAELLDDLDDIGVEEIPEDDAPAEVLAGSASASSSSATVSAAADPPGVSRPGKRDREADSSAAMLVDQAGQPHAAATSQAAIVGRRRREPQTGLMATGGVPVGPVTAVATLLRDRDFQVHMERVRTALLSPAPAAIVGVLEDHPEYILTVKSNSFLAKLREEAEAVREFTSALYSQHFSDLASIVTDGLQYARVVSIVRDCPAADVTALAPRLESVVSGSTALVITVSGSALDACKLTDDELRRVDEACREAEDLAAARATILRFVQTRMRFLAPNLSSLLGTSLASELVGMAGGLVALTRIPACNVQVMGRSKASANGMSRTSVKAHNGIIHEAEIVRAAPPALRQKTAKVLAAKVALAARIDAFRSDVSGSTGQAVADSIRDKIAKWAAPPEVKAVKPLPIPEGKKSRKRGGKRFRRLKEKYGQTDVRKAANRLAVDQSGVEYSESAMGNDGGMLGMGGSGRIRVAASKRVAQVGGNKAAAARSKAAAAGSATMSGLTSTIAFSHTLGMELVDPDAGKKAAAKAKASSGYFDDAAKFRSE